MTARKPYSCTACGGEVGAARFQQTRTYVDIEADGGEARLSGGENEVLEENWHFFCLANRDHRLSPQLLAALDRLVEKESQYGLDF